MTTPIRPPTETLPPVREERRQPFQANQEIASVVLSGEFLHNLDQRQIVIATVYEQTKIGR